MTGWLRRAAVASLVLLLLTVTAVIAAGVLMVHRHADGRSLQAPVDAAIVLGGGRYPDGALEPSTLRRVQAGVALLLSGAAGRLVMSGGLGDPRLPSIAESMRDHAVALGAPPEAVLVEGRSRTTFENFRFSLDLARRAGLHDLAVVTDDWHLLRAAALGCYFGACAIGLVAAPALGAGSAAELVHDIGRESLAWWYNVGKVAAWSALGALGVPESRREWLVA